MREKTTPTRTTAATKTATRRRKRNTTTPRTTAPAWQLVYVSWLVHWYFCYAIPTGPLWFVNAAGASTFSSLNLKESHRRRAASHSYSPTEICENLRSKRYKQQAATGQHLKANREAQQCHTSCFIITNHISSQAGAQSKIKVIYSNHQSDASSICAGGALLHCFTHFILHSADMHCIIIQKKQQLPNSCSSEMSIYIIYILSFAIGMHISHENASWMLIGCCNSDSTVWSISQMLLQQPNCLPSDVGQHAPVMFKAAQAENLEHSVPGAIFTSCGGLEKYSEVTEDSPSTIHRPSYQNGSKSYLSSLRRMTCCSLKASWLSVEKGELQALKEH